MAAKVDPEKCCGCETCVNTCPVGTISMQDGKAVVGADCVECGACVGECPAEAISL
ncbi:MAG: 4Fe-4S binding protein [Victivallaceae bacterium]|nr:4Fe-4S binding protein [Victivallaceae bacterium]